MLTPPHGGQLGAIARQFDIDASKLIDFSANINPDGPPLRVLRVMRDALDDHTTLSLYPDLEEVELKRSIASYAGVDPAQVAVANGFVPLLEAALRALAIRRCLLPVPAFTEYRKTLERADVQITPHPLSDGDDFSYSSVYPLGDHDAILLANPQNPSGVVISRLEMLRIVAEAADRNIVVFLDEAFIDYIPEHSLTRDVDRFSNLIVFRSVTKFHAMPGLRVAYAIANAALIKSVNSNLPPWPITTLASRGVCAALADEDYAIRTRGRNLARREALVSGLRRLGLDPLPSAANFVLFRAPDSLWQRLILEHRIVLRECSNYESLPSGYLRAAVRTEVDNAILLNALDQTANS